MPPHLSPNARGDLLRGYGALIRSLGGLYETGPDVGTSSADMDIIAETGAPYVRATTTAAGGAGDSSGPTAAGVVAAIEAVLESLFGDRSPERRRFVVQGAGSVGGRVTAVLAARGGHVAVCDVDRSALDRLTSEFAVETIDPNGVYDLPCDLFVPCALGGILNQETIPRLRCRAVCGAANNQIAGPGDAGRLRARGILYAPDYVVSLGGAVAITGIESLGWATDEATSRVVETIRNAVHRILVMADAEGITTVDAAERLVIERLR